MSVGDVGSVPGEEGTIIIVVPGTVFAVHTAAAAVRGIAETVLSPDDADGVEVMVAEVGNNIVLHGFGACQGEADAREFVLEVRAKDGELILQFLDDGPPFDPTRAPLGTPEESLARGGGGLGLYIIHRVADELVYHRVDAQNVLRIVKRRTKERNERQLPADPSARGAS